jgi:large subunit ribosomal protein L21
MYAIVEIAGQQFKVVENQKLFVHRLEQAEGDSVSFNKVLLIDNDGQVNVGAPVIKDAEVTAKVLKHLKGDKVIVFKKRRRKGYKVKNGHRQCFSQIEIVSIGTVGDSSKKSTEETAKPAAEVAATVTEVITPVAEVATPAAEVVAPAKSGSKAKKKVAAGDDLTLIEGIGPKAAEALINAGIDTFEKLSQKPADEIRAILTEASGTLAHLDPQTWAQQAELAATGKFDELKAWQDELKGGKAVE